MSAILVKTRIEALNLISSSILSTKDALKVGLNPYDLSKLVEEGVLERDERGVYRKVGHQTPENESYARALAHLGEPSVISLWSALSFHDLTEEVPSNIWVYLPFNKYSHLKGLVVVRKKNPYWNIGIETYDGIRITNIERSLVDALADGRHFDKFTPFRMVLAAIRSKKTTETKLLKMAKQLGVEKRVSEKLLLLQDTYV
jgi:predicted transcriptional regulator of viral defense system